MNNKFTPRNAPYKKAVYLILIYIIAQFVWWGYLIVSQSYSIEKALLSRKVWMVIGEGSIFIVLVVVGFIQIIKSIEKEQILIHNKQNFLLSVSHELKSPLTAIKLSLQTLKKGEIPFHQIQKISDISIQQTERLSKLVDNILLTSTLENNSFTPYLEKVNINDIYEQIIDELLLLYKKPKELYVFKNNTSNHVIIDKVALYSILFNLIENATKYSPLEAPIKTSLSLNNHHYILTVSDSGAGISDPDKKKVFNLFYRVGDENTRTNKGTGLGLYIVKKMIQTLKGEIFIKDNTPNGCIFEVIFKQNE